MVDLVQYRSLKSDVRHESNGARKRMPEFAP